LLLGFARRVARFVLAHERLDVIVVAVKSLVCVLLSRAALLLLRLLVVVWVLLSELLLRGSDQTEIMLGVLIVVFGRNRIGWALRVASKLNIFFCDVGGGAANFYVGTIRLVNTRQWILALAVIAASAHALLTVSHGVPVFAFRLSRSLNA